MMEIFFYHGGVPGLLPGDFILPASMIQVDTTIDQTKMLPTTKIGATYRADRVYVTPDFHSALFIAMVRRPSAFGVYEVEPIGEIVETEFSDMGERHCEKALIVDVVNLPDKEIERARRLVLRRASSMPLLAGRLLTHTREQRETPEREQRRRDRRAFEKKAAQNSPLRAQTAGGRIAVKGIYHQGDDVMKVFKVQ